MLSRYFLDFSVGVGAFVIGMSQISSFSLKVVHCSKDEYVTVYYIVLRTSYITLQSVVTVLELKTFTLFWIG